MKITVTAAPTGAVLRVDGVDVRRVLPSEAAAYASTMTAYAERADVARRIRSQMADPFSGIGPAGREVVAEYLASVPPAGVHDVAPLRLTLASAPSLLGMVGIRCGATSGVWTSQECRDHALDLMRACAHVDALAIYRRVLGGGWMGLPADRVDLIVADLGNYMPTRTADLDQGMQ